MLKIDKAIYPGWLVLLLGLLVLVVLASLSIGSYPVSIREILRFVGAFSGIAEMPPARYEILHNLLIDIRLPRVLAAVLVGAALAVSGASYQAVFRNPLVSPGLLGVLAGASFGASVGMLLDGSWVMVQALAFASGILAVAVGVGIANAFGSASMITLILGGMISNTVFGAMLSLVKYAADPQNQLPAITYWMMGNLAMMRLPQLALMAIPILAASVFLSLLGKALDAMSMGEDEARSLGVPINVVRYGVIAAATLVSALSVSIAGMIGWVGLMIPHVVRLLLGPGNVRLLPASILLGSSFLVAADSLSRGLFQIEIPIGIVTECIGIPVFLLVLNRARRGWS